MASNEKIRKTYVLTPQLAPDTFYFDSVAQIFYIGKGTDLHSRLFWLKLTNADRELLKGMKIDPDK